MAKRLIVAAILCCSVSTIICDSQEIFRWNLATYNFDAGATQDHVKMFSPENIVLTGLEVAEDKIFLATPRLRAGVPATLSVVPRNAPLGSSPILQAFPDWSWHDSGREEYNCSGLISVYRLRSDRCGRLWVLDSGIMNSLEEFKRVCQPKIVIFDIRTSRPLKVIRFPDDLLRTNSLFTNLIIDETTSSPFNGCDDVSVYISDTAAPGMIVYDGATDSAWRVTHASMYPDPDFSDYQIGNDKFTLMDGVVGLAFSPALKTVYFQPLATDRIFSISTDALRQGPPPEGQELPVILVGRKSTQGLGLAVDPFTDTLFYSPLTETAIASWNPHSNTHKVLDYDPDKLQFCAEVRWISNDPNAVWALSSRFHKFFLRNVDPLDINIRVIRVSVGHQPPSQRFYRQANVTSYY